MFRRVLNDWGIDRISSLLQILNTFTGRSESSDKHKCTLSRKDIFTVKSTYRNLIVSIQNLSLCGNDAKNIDRLSIHGKTTTNFWHMFFCILGVNYVMPKNTLDLLIAGRGLAEEME